MEVWDALMFCHPSVRDVSEPLCTISDELAVKSPPERTWVGANVGFASQATQSRKVKRVPSSPITRSGCRVRASRLNLVHV